MTHQTHWTGRAAVAATVLAVAIVLGGPAAEEAAGAGQPVCVSFDPGNAASVFTHQEIMQMSDGVVKQAVAFCGKELKPWAFHPQPQADAARMEFRLARLPTRALVLCLRVRDAQGDDLFPEVTTQVVAEREFYPPSQVMAANVQAVHVPELLRGSRASLARSLALRVPVAQQVFYDVVRAVADVLLDVQQFASLTNRRLKIVGMCAGSPEIFLAERAELGQRQVANANLPVWRVEYCKYDVDGNGNWQDLKPAHKNCLPTLTVLGVYLEGPPQPVPAGFPITPSVAPPAPPAPGEHFEE